MMKIHAEKAAIKKWLDVLGTASRNDHYPKLWKRIHALVNVPERRRASVNLYKIDRYTKEGENVIVPGKVLSSGEIKHKVNIAAIEFSDAALKGLKEANCNIVDIKDMLASGKVKVLI